MHILILVKDVDHFSEDDATKMLTVLGTFPTENDASEFRLIYAQGCEHGDVLSIVTLDFVYGQAIHDNLVIYVGGTNDKEN